jgi:hypothetical protein
MKARSNATYAIAALGTLLLAGCADGSLGSGFNTGSIDPQKQAAAEQAKNSKQALCNTLVSQIDALNGEGISDKMSKAAAKKYKLKPTDLTKADELNKANTEFQSKCSDFPPRVAATAPIEPVTTGAATAAPAKTAAATTTAPATAKAKPAAPAQKPVAAAMMPQDAVTTTGAATPTTTATTDTGGVPNP